MYVLTLRTNEYIIPVIHRDMMHEVQLQKVDKASAGRSQKLHGGRQYEQTSASRGKSDITLQRLVIEALPLRIITRYNALSTTDVPKTADQYIPA